MPTSFRRRTWMGEGLTSMQHVCQLEADEVIAKFIESGIFIPLRRRFRKYMMISKQHPYTLHFVSSLHEFRKQELRHLVKFYYVIHPFSKFALLWVHIMMFALTGFLLIIPMQIASPLTKIGDTRYPMLVCQVLHILHIFLRFWMGLYLRSSNRILLNPKDFIWHYVHTYFLIEVLTCIPFYVSIRASLHMEDTHPLITRILLFMKLLLLPQWLEYIRIIQAYHKLNDYSVSMFKIVMGFVLGLLWTFSIIWNSGKKGRYWSWEHFLEQLERSTIMLSLAGIPDRKQAYVIHIVFILLGFIFQLLLCVGISTVWRKYNSVVSRHENFLKSMDAFMKYNDLPQNKRDRIRSYVNFKFQGKFYKEKAINDILSPRLKEDVMECMVEANMENIELLLHLPNEILIELCKYLKVETYVAGDVIVRSGCLGSSMYFIVAGTVGLLMPTGKYVAILKDGMNFGEVSLILQISLVASAVAIKPCEILRLHRANFLAVFAKCKSTLDMLQEVTEQHLMHTQLFHPDSVDAILTRSMVVNPGLSQDWTTAGLEQDSSSDDADDSLLESHSFSTQMVGLSKSKIRLHRKQRGSVAELQIKSEVELSSQRFD